MQRGTGRHRKWTHPSRQQHANNTVADSSASPGINPLHHSHHIGASAPTTGPLQQQYARVSKYSLQLKATDAAQSNPCKHARHTGFASKNPLPLLAAASRNGSCQHATATSKSASGRGRPNRVYIRSQDPQPTNMPHLAQATPAQCSQHSGIVQQSTASWSDQPGSSTSAAGPSQPTSTSCVPTSTAAVQPIQQGQHSKCQDNDVQQSIQQSQQQQAINPKQGELSRSQQACRQGQQQAQLHPLQQVPRRPQQPQSVNAQLQDLQQQSVRQPHAHVSTQQMAQGSASAISLQRPAECKQPQRQRPRFVRRAARGGKLITCPSQHENVKLVYKKCGNKLERTRVQAAVAGANLTWVNTVTAPHLAAAAQAAVNAATTAAAAQREKRMERLKQQHLRRQQRLEQRRQQTLARRQAAASRSLSAVAAGGMTARLCTAGGHSKAGAPSYKLVRIGGQLYYSTPKGLCSAAAARQLARRNLSRQFDVNSNRRACAAAAAPAARIGLGVQKSITKPSSSSKQVALRLPAVLVPVAGLSKRILSSSAVARSLAVVRGRNAAKKAAIRRGMCLHYCKMGKCDLALRGKCEKVHDPSKVAVCQQWLAGKCTSQDCRLQHQVVPELMPVCMYYLEGVCSNRDCPYLHVKVAADAPACRAFLQGYCPAGASCPHKHLTARMIKQLKLKQIQEQLVSGSGADTGMSVTEAASRAGKVQQQVRQRSQQQKQVSDLRDTTPAVSEVVDRSGSVEFGRSLEDLLPRAE